MVPIQCVKGCGRVKRSRLCRVGCVGSTTFGVYLKGLRFCYCLSLLGPVWTTRPGEMRPTYILRTNEFSLRESCSSVFLSAEVPVLLLLHWSPETLRAPSQCPLRSSRTARNPPSRFLSRGRPRVRRSAHEEVLQLHLQKVEDVVAKVEEVTSLLSVGPSSLLSQSDRRDVLPSPCLGRRFDGDPYLLPPDGPDEAVEVGPVVGREPGERGSKCTTKKVGSLCALVFVI